MKAALIIIDAINDIINPNYKTTSCGKYLSEHPEIISNINQLTRNFRNEQLPVIFIKLAFQEDYSDCSSLLPFSAAKELGIFRQGTDGTKFYKSLEIVSTDIIITKIRVSPFYRTNLHELLQERKVTKIVITGFATDNAVNLLAREASDRDYEVIIASDACGAATQEKHDMAIELLKGKVRFITTHEFLKNS